MGGGNAGGGAMTTRVGSLRIVDVAVSVFLSSCPLARPCCVGPTRPHVAVVIIPLSSQNDLSSRVPSPPLHLE